MMHHPFIQLSDGLAHSGCRTLLYTMIVFLLLLQSGDGQHQVVGPSQPIRATIGDDIILPCHLEPAKDASDMKLEWARPDLNPRFIHVRANRQEYVIHKQPSYKGRTSVSNDKLKHGDVSLTLSKVKVSDEGLYRCLIPSLNQAAFIQLIVGAVSSPVINLENRSSRRVVLQCESAGWYPEPEVLWLDGEGKLLSAGPTETVRGPDDLYTVSSRVTVEKRHSNSFTCRVQQRNINQTRETHISVLDDFLKAQSSASSIKTGLAVSLAAVCIMFIVLLLTFLWKWRQNIIKTKRRYCVETDRGHKKNSSKTNKTEDQSASDEESEHLMTTETVEMKIKKQRCQQQLLEEQQRREEAEKEVQTLKEELETKKKEVEPKQCELQQLHEEKQRNKDELQTLKEELETKNKELETIKKTQGLFFSARKRKEAEKEAETLTKQLETQQMELDTKMKKIDEKQAEVQQLQNEIQRMESNLQTLMETLYKNMEVEDNEQAAEMEWKKKYDMLMESKHEDIHMFKKHIDQLLADVKKLTEEKQRIENERQLLQKELERNKQAAERELKEAQRQLKNKDTEINRRKKDLQHGEREVEKVERLMKELADRNIEWQKKLSDERTRREEAEREVEALKKELMTKPKTNESVPVQHGASSPT